MDKFEKKLGAAKQIHLTDSEKGQIREELMVFMEKNPVRAGRFIRLQGWRPHLFFNSLTPKSMPALALLIALFLGIGTSAAAESSLPGDLLYPVKVHVNEEVEGWFNPSGSAAASWETRRVETRLQETEKLALSGKLDAAAQAQIEDNVAAHAGRIRDQIAALTAAGKLDAAATARADFETSLKAHQSILAHLQSGSSAEVRAVLGNVGGEVKSQLDAVVGLDEKAKAKADADASSSASTKTDSIKTESNVNADLEIKAAAQGKMNAAENKISEVKNFIEEKNAQLSADAKAQAEAKVTAADALMVEGKAQLSANAYAEAEAKFDEAFHTAEEGQKIAQALLELPMKIELQGQTQTQEATTAPAENPASTSVKTEDHATANGSAGIQLPGTSVKSTGQASGDAKLNLGL